MEPEQEIMIATALDCAYVNCNIAEGNLTNAILKQKVKRYQTINLTNKILLEQKKLENEHKEADFKEKREKIIQDIVDKSTQAILDHQNQNEQQITELNYQIFELSQKIDSATKHKNEILKNISNPIPKFDRKIVGEYENIEKRINSLREEIEKKKSQPKPQPSNIMGFSLKDVVQDETSQKSRKSKK